MKLSSKPWLWAADSCLTITLSDFNSFLVDVKISLTRSHLWDEQCIFVSCFKEVSSGVGEAAQ